eukprot:2147743-Ditylum_brightwellii.AAC.1
MTYLYVHGCTLPVLDNDSSHGDGDCLHGEGAADILVVRSRPLEKDMVVVRVQKINVSHNHAYVMVLTARLFQQIMEAIAVEV